MGIVGIIIMTILYAGFKSGSGEDGKDTQGGFIGAWAAFIFMVVGVIVLVGVGKICCSTGLSFLLTYPMMIYLTVKFREHGRKGAVILICSYALLFLLTLSSTVTSCNGIISSSSLYMRTGLSECESCVVSSVFAGAISLFVIAYEVIRLIRIKRGVANRSASSESEDDVNEQTNDTESDSPERPQ